MSDKLQGVMENGYGLIAKKVMKDKKLDIEAKAIYAYLASYTGGGITAYPSVSLIISDLNISENRYYKYRKQLLKEGYISIKKNRKDGKRDNNIYVLNPDPKKQHLQNEGIEFEGIEFEGTNKNNLNNNSSNRPSPKDDDPPGDEFSIKKQDNGMYDYPEDFEKIWSAYPDNNCTKKAAWRKWAARRRDGISQDKLLKAAKGYAQYIKKENQQDYVKYFSTFFGPDEWWKQYLKDQKEHKKKMDEIARKKKEQLKKQIARAEKLG